MKTYTTKEVNELIKKNFELGKKEGKRIVLLEFWEYWNECCGKIKRNDIFLISIKSFMEGMTNHII